MYDVVISKGGSHIYIYKKVAPHYNSYTEGPYRESYEYGPHVLIFKGGVPQY